MSYSVLRKFLSTTALIAAAAALSACSGDVERFGTPGFEGFSDNQKDVFTNSVKPVVTAPVYNQKMPDAVPQVQRPTYSAPVYTVPQTVAVQRPVQPVVQPSIVTNSIQAQHVAPVYAAPQITNGHAAVPVYRSAPVYNSVQVPVVNQPMPAAVYAPSHPVQRQPDYMATGSIGKKVLDPKPVVISKFHALPKRGPRKNGLVDYAVTNAVSGSGFVASAGSRAPVAQPMPPMPSKTAPSTGRFSISKFFSLPKSAPRAKRDVDYTSTAAIRPPQSIPVEAAVPVSHSGGTQVVSVAPVSLKSNQAVRTSGRWTSLNGTMINARSGDDLNSISRRYGVPAKAIADVNGLAGHSFIAPGQKILIPTYQQTGIQSDQGGVQRVASLPGASLMPSVIRTPRANPLRLQGQTAYGRQILRMQQTANSEKRHMVMPGDSLSSIASRYNVSVASLAQRNNISPTAHIRMGQRLHIPSATANQPGVDYTSTASINRGAFENTTSNYDSAFRLGSLPKAKPRHAINKPLAAVRVNNTGPITALPKAKVRQRVASLDKQTAGMNTTRSDASQSPSTGQSVSAATTAQNKFRWPVRGRIISNYGRKRDGGRNDGINLQVPEGTSVRVAESGTVIYAGDELKGYGQLVLVQHSNGWVTAYAHNSKMLVIKGQQVRRGQIIAQAGKTGNVDSPQLHFELRIKGDPVDPVPYLVPS